MKTKAVSATLIALSLVAFGAVVSNAQHEVHSTEKNPSQSAARDKKAMPHDLKVMGREPHHVLAMAYHQNLLAFTKALQGQTELPGPVNIEFARDAVAEMQRSFDRMKDHHQEHMQTMSAEMHSKMSGMMQQMETHQTELKTQLEALDHEVQSTAPDAKNVSTLAAAVHTHIDGMSEMHNGCQTMGMKM